MRTPDQIRAEIARLKKAAEAPRTARYKATALWARIDTLLWALGEPSMFDDEER